jgi:hypothetical protein
MPFHNLRGTIFGLVIVMTLPATAMAQSQATPSIDDLLRGMTDTLKSSAALTLHVEKLFDDVLVTGEKLQYAGAVDVALRRPNRFHVSYGDDLSAMEAWYDGSLFVLVDLMAGVYGLLPSSDTIDTTLATVAETYGVRMPLGGLLSNDAYELITERATQKRYVGLHDVGGVPAHHIYLTDGTVAWQLWIDAGESPLPVKLVVTTLDLPGAPQTIFFFTEWDLDPDLPDETFAPEIPDGAALAAFLPVKGE